MIARQSTAQSRAQQAGAEERRRAWAPLVAVLAPIVLLYVAAAIAMPVPVNYVPDEPYYVHLARTLAHGQGFAWRGEPVPLRSALYIYLIAPAWKVADVVTAYQIAKVASALLGLLVAVPVYAVASALLPRRLAIAAVVLTLAGTWMNTGEVMTESIALPLATAALACAVLGLQRGTSRPLWVALVFAFLAAWARAQVVVLVPALGMALVLDIVVHRAGWRRRWRVNRWPLAVAVAVSLGGVVAERVLGPKAVLGTYESVASQQATLGAVLRNMGFETLLLGAMCGVAPLALLVVVAFRPRAWRDDALRPLMVVLLPAIVAFAGQSAFYVAGISGLAPIQRYVMYVVPLLLVFALVAATRPRIAGALTFVGVAVVALAAHWIPAHRPGAEDQAAMATSALMRHVFSGATNASAVLVVGVVVGLVVAAAAWRAGPSGSHRTAGVLAAAVVLVVGAQSVFLYARLLAISQQDRDMLPADLTWVDDHTSKPVAAFVVSDVGFEWPMLELFNERLQTVYASSPSPGGGYFRGPVCQWRYGAGGIVDSDCPLRTDTLLLNDPMRSISFYNELHAVADPHAGRLVQVRPPLLLKAVIETPCGRHPPMQDPLTKLFRRDLPVPCTPAVIGTFWLHRPATLEIVVRGAPSGENRALVGKRIRSIPHGRTTTLRTPVPVGDDQQVVVKLDWAEESARAPVVERVDLVQDGRRQRLS